nr:MAG TPA: hypothetical protein [Bacteriophage sp.]
MPYWFSRFLSERILRLLFRRSIQALLRAPAKSNT